MKLYPILTAVACALTLTATAQNNLKSQMLSHVEKILVIDSIAVDKDAFFKAYRIHPSTGRILTSEQITETLKDVEMPESFLDTLSYGFTNEYNDYLIWAQQDTTGYYRLAESVRLGDGTWSTPQFTSPLLNAGKETDLNLAVTHNAAFPFMSDDGQTLYFASDNSASLGGYDIFIAKKDPYDGSFLIPGNMGLPFNSEYDDYMMVIDLQTGVGWWATDRNQLEDQLTIYVYALADQRVTVDPSDENLQQYASLYGWEELLDEEAIQRRDQIRAEIESISIPDERTPEFELPMPGGKFYRYFSDFKNPEAASLMKDYLEIQDTLNRLNRQLSSLREQYYKAGGDKNIGNEIALLEKEIKNLSASAISLKSQIYKVEK